MPTLKKVDYLKALTAKKPEEVKGLKLAERFDSFVEDEILPYMQEKLDEVFGEVKLTQRSPKSPSEVKDKKFKMFGKGNYLIKQLVDVEMDNETVTLTLAEFESREDFEERFLEVTAKLFDNVS